MTNFRTQTELRTRLTEENPWPGLAAFSEADTRFFHGRESETSELLRLVLRSPVVVFHGASGLGKTSLLRAGLLPQLPARDILPVWLRLDHSIQAPALAQQIKTTLSQALDTAGVDSPRPQPDETLWEYFHRRDRDFWGPRNRLLTPLLIFDQFEELFTLGRKTTEAAARSEEFKSELEWLLEHRTPPPVAQRLEENPDASALYDFGRRGCRVLLSLREDFLAELGTLERRVAALGEGRFRLVPMTTGQALSAVLQSGGPLVTPPVASEIINFVSAAKRVRPCLAESTPDSGISTVEPALLSVVCRELNQRRIAANHQQITTELLQGSQAGIIRTFYDRAFENLDPRVRDFVEDELLTTSGFRDRAAVEDALKLPGVTDGALEALVDRRVLQRQERSGVEWIELTHDLLTGPAQSSRAERQSRNAVAEARTREEAARRTARRTRKAAILVTAGITAVLATIIVVSQQALRRIGEEKQVADRERKRASEMASEAQSAKEIAEHNRDELREALGKVEEENARAQKAEKTARENYLRALEGRLQTHLVSQGLGSRFGTFQICKSAVIDEAEANLSSETLQTFRHAAISAALRSDFQTFSSVRTSRTGGLRSILSDGRTVAGESQGMLSLESHEKKEPFSIRFKLPSPASSIAGPSADGLYLATTHGDARVRLWHRTNETPVWETSATAAGFSSTSNLLATAFGTEVQVFELPKRRGVWKSSLSKSWGPVRAIQFSPDAASVLLTVGTNGLVLASLKSDAVKYATSVGELVDARWQASSRAAFCTIADATGDASLVAWDPETDESILLRHDVEPRLGAFDVHPEGRVIAFVTTDSRFHIADIRSMQDLLMAEAGPMLTVRFSADGDRLILRNETVGDFEYSIAHFAAGSDLLGFQQDLISQLGAGLRLKGNSMLRFDDLGVEGRSVEITTRASGETSIRSYVRPPLAGANFGGEPMLLVRGAREELTIWEPDRGFLVAKTDAPALTGLVVGPRGNQLVYMTRTELWHWQLQMPGGEISPERPILNEPPERVLDGVSIVRACFSGDGRRFAAADAEGICRIFDLPKAKEFLRMKLDAEGALYGLDSEGDVLVSADSGGIDAWRLPARLPGGGRAPGSEPRRLWRLDIPGSPPGAVSADGTLLAVGGAEELEFYRLQDGKLLGKANVGPYDPELLCFSSDSKLVAFAATERHIGLVDSASLALLDTFELPNGDRVESLGFLRDSTVLALTLNGGRLRRVNLREVSEELQRVSPKLALNYLPSPSTIADNGRRNMIPGGTMPARSSARLISLVTGK